MGNLRRVRKSLEQGQDNSNVEDLPTYDPFSLPSCDLNRTDAPWRWLQGKGGARQVILPPQILRALEIKAGDFLSFRCTGWPGTVGIRKEGPKPGEFLADNFRGRPDAVRKVYRSSGNSLSVTIPKNACKVLSAELGDLLNFTITPVPGLVTICVVKGYPRSAGSRRPG